MTPTPQRNPRYDRHLQLPEIGAEGQARLGAASVLVVGAGGLGSPVLLYLAAAGVGRLGLIDDDVVDRTNLQRQVLYTDAAVGQPKVHEAAAQLRALNPDICIEPHEERLTAANAASLLERYDLIVSGADNFPTRYLVNDACVLLKKPIVHGAIHRFEGEVSVFVPGGPCYRCLHPQPPAPGSVPSCGEAGVLGVLPGVIGTLQATEALKLVLGIGTTLAGRLLLFDALALRFRELALRRNPACPVCGDHPTITAITDTASSCDAVKEPMMNLLTPTQLKERLDRGDDFVLIDVREPHEYELCHIPGARLIPLGTLPSQLATLDPDADTVVMCRSGRRSGDAVAWLMQQGFTTVANLEGGILRWSDDVDPSVPKY